MIDCIEHSQNMAIGYGSKSVKVDGKWVSVGMHRVAYCEANDVSLESIKGLVIRHKCDNPKCINPAHLELGTKGDNNKDRAIRGRSARGLNLYGKRSTTKLKPIDVQQIRESTLSGTFLAEIFGVSQSTISMARRGQIHKYNPKTLKHY